MPDTALSISSPEEIRSFVDMVAAATVTRYPDPDQTALIGIRSRGVHLAERIRAKSSKLLGGASVNMGILDITLYRDDLDDMNGQPRVRRTDLPFDVTGKVIILVDDVLNTGRTVRAAIDQIMDFGRPKAIRLAVLIDRGNRELPIHPDLVGKVLEISQDQDVQVRLQESDGADGVFLAAKRAR